MTTFALYIDANSEDEATDEVASLLGTEPLPWAVENDGYDEAQVTVEVTLKGKVPGSLRSDMMLDTVTEGLRRGFDTFKWPALDVEVSTRQIGGSSIIRGRK